MKPPSKPRIPAAMLRYAEASQAPLDRKLPPAPKANPPEAQEPTVLEPIQAAKRPGYRAGGWK